MNVRVEVVSNESVELGSSAGFYVTFAADVLRGQAWFIPSGGRDAPPRCGEYSVETGVRGVRHMKVVAPSPDSKPGIAALPEAASYRVRGIVESTWPDGEAGVGLNVRAGGWIFWLNTEDCAADDRAILGSLAVGDEVEFEAIELSQWDKDI